MASPIVVPPELARLQAKHNGDTGRAWITALPALVESTVERWELRVAGPPMHGMAALVLPVHRPDGTPAALKLQPVDEESVGEPDALRAWAGAGAVRMLAHDPGSGSMLLERLDPTRTLSTVADPPTALDLLCRLLARLLAVPAPPGLRHLADITAGMVERLPAVLATLPDQAHRTVLRNCAAAVAEVRPEPGSALLHWDLHYDNVLHSIDEDREPWLAIDPKPLVGDPGFDLLPALRNRWPDIAASSDPVAAVLARFDRMTEILDLNRARAAAWTLGRVLQDSLWEVEDGARELGDIPLTVYRAMLRRAHPQ